MEHYAAWSSKQKPAKKTWSKPPPECYKVNFDAISSEDFSTQAAVCRNSNGIIIQMISQFHPPAVLSMVQPLLLIWLVFWLPP
jgi:hypothetical protein